MECADIGATHETGENNKNTIPSIAIREDALNPYRIGIQVPIQGVGGTYVLRPTASIDVQKHLVKAKDQI